MRSRQRGVAHVSIMWFIIMTVLFLGGVGFAYIQMQEVADSTARLQKAQEEVQAERRKAEAEYDAKLLISRAAGFNGGDDNAPANVDLIRQKIQEIRPLIDAGTSDVTLQSLLPRVETKVASLSQEIKDLKQALAAAESARDQTNASLRNLQRDKDQVIAQLNAEKGDIETNLRRQITDKENANSELRNSVRSKNEELSKAREEWEGERKNFLGEIRDLTLRNEKARDKLAIIEDPDKVDGRIISTSEKIARAWIDLGRKHMVRAGMTFEILELKGNNYVHKAWAEVLTVDAESSEIAISDLANEFNPVAKGDFVRNQLYDRDVRFNFVLLGRFVDPLTKGDIKRILEMMGNQVTEEVGADTDFLVLGRQPIGEDVTALEQTEDYARALKFSVNIVPLKKIQGFLKL